MKLNNYSKIKFCNELTHFYYNPILVYVEFNNHKQLLKDKQLENNNLIIINKGR